MNILITGCNGQLGNEMQLLQSSAPQHSFFNTDIQELDITDARAVDAFVKQNSIDGIVNCAAYTAVDKAESNPELCRTLNAVAPEILAKAVEARQGWIIQISTDYVYESSNNIPLTEDCPTAPDSVYGITKLEGELRVIAACNRAVIIRTAWLYSTFGNNFVKTMLRLGRERETLGVVVDQAGTPTYAADLAAAIMHIIDRGIVPGVYNYSNEGVCSWYDFTKAIHRIAGITTCNVSPLHTADYPTPARRPAYSVLDKTKIRKTFGITIPHWEESLRRCMQSLVLPDHA